ncbi:MAG TPA: PH domain-containing protein, partial [Blastocatellia bacterium]|nr:PH domain-containing protein [Blastocatellia bacterium]
LSSLGVIAFWPGYGDAEVNLTVSLAGLLGGLILFASVACIHLEMRQTAYAVTATSAHARWSLLFKHDEGIQLDAVRSIRVSEGPLQRLFKLGNLVPYTTSNDVLVFWDIAQPVEKKN